MSSDQVPFNPPRMSRAERRRAERGGYEGGAGVTACKFCKSVKGSYEKAGNRFRCANGCDERKGPPPAPPKPQKRVEIDVEGKNEKK